MNALDQLELDVLAATGDVELAEHVGLICYMFGLRPELVTGMQIVGIWTGYGAR